uniref:Ion transport domain-containing protein n=2 Tax=Pediculus humanus subsp. corporis TaxID=121224 RepID=A0A1S4MLC8_PEDHC
MSTAKRLVATLRGQKNSTQCGETTGCNSSSSTRLFSSNPRGSIFNNSNSNNELDEIAIVSNAEPCQVKYGSGPLQSTANGPRLVPGIITSQGRMIGERLSASGTRLNSGSPVQYTETGGRRTSRSVSKQSLLDLVSCKLGKSKQNQRYFSTSRDSLTAAYRTTAVSSTASELDLRKKARKKDLRGRLKLPPSVVLLPACGSEPLLRSKNWSEKGSSGGGGNLSVQKQEKGNLTPTESDRLLRSHMRLHVAAPNWSFVFDPAGRLCYYWSIIVSLAFLYNFWVIIYRFAFQEINRETIVLWFCLDYMSDLLYLIDIVFHFRTGYLEDGVLQTDAAKLRNHYMNSTTFYIDCLCLLPLDFLYLSIGFNSILRTFR